ncbi:hypothetical protein PIB30_030270 [Stylosanthes scabra]|uniref:Uncharacterized protein n=1 Tax=Stylosanthes scabra TaxID=79078 RepID=A0ABU6Y9V8_9FABA|nr:hypothetical protein [Stylosanthes scabra]
MSVRPRNGRRIFGLYEESFHDFKGRYFKVFPVGDHPPFWLTLERVAVRFPLLLEKLNEEQRDTADILLWLFSVRNLQPKAILGNPERARAYIDPGKPSSGHGGESQWPIVVSSSASQASSSIPEGGGSSTAGGGTDTRPEVSSLIRGEGPEQQIEIVPPSPLGKRANDEAVTTQKRPRMSEGFQRDFCPMDRSFDASAYIENNFLGLRAREALQDYDPMESIRWA